MVSNINHYVKAASFSLYIFHVSLGEVCYALVSIMFCFCYVVIAKQSASSSLTIWIWMWGDQ